MMMEAPVKTTPPELHVPSSLWARPGPSRCRAGTPSQRLVQCGLGLVNPNSKSRPRTSCSPPSHYRNPRLALPHDPSPSVVNFPNPTLQPSSRLFPKPETLLCPCDYPLRDMINAFLVFNGQGVPRLTKFYTQLVCATLPNRPPIVYASRVAPLFMP